MSETLEIKGTAPKSEYTGAPGWETHGEQGVLIMAAQTLPNGVYVGQVTVKQQSGKKEKVPVTRKPLIVEIGSENGMSASLFRTFAPDATLVCVEIDREANFLHNLKAVGLYDEHVVPVFANSAKITWPEIAEGKKLPREIDLLFIDGDHSFDGALADLRNFAPYVAKDGWLLLHDCACSTNRQPHPQHHTVTAALQNYMVEQGHALGFKFLFSVDTMTVYRRF